MAKRTRTLLVTLTVIGLVAATVIAIHLLGNVITHLHGQ
jgi:hypothetical protein